MDYDLGLDAGTTNTCVVADGEVVEVHSGFATFPSIVRVGPDGSFTIPTRLQSPSSHIQHLPHCKRLIGRRAEDGRLRSDVDRVPHAVLDEHGAHYMAAGSRVNAVEVWAFILGRARRAAENKYGGAARRAVLTVPAYYGISQCEAIRNAAEIGGFDMSKTRFVTEPVAITVDQIELDDREKTGKYPDASHVVVIDLGGGTADITEIYFERLGGKRAYVVQAIEGDNFLGGADFDQCLLGLVEKKASDAGHGDKFDKHKLLSACENARIELTDASVARIELPTPDQGSPPAWVTITRGEFNAACKGLIDKMSELLDRLPSIRDGKRPASVLIAGGASQMPCIKDLCVQKFPGTEITPVRGAAETVARGAWRIARAEHIAVSDVLGKSIGVEAFIPDPTPKDRGQRRLATERVVSRNVRVPTTATYTFVTKEKDQAAVDLKFLEGEDTETDLNTVIDVMEIREIPKCRKGTKISVDLTVNGPGDFTVNATIKNRCGKLKVTPQRFLDAPAIEAFKIDTARRLDGNAVQTREAVNTVIGQDSSHGDGSRGETGDANIRTDNVGSGLGDGGGVATSATPRAKPAASNGDETHATDESDSTYGTSGSRSGKKRPRNKVKLGARTRLRT